MNHTYLERALGLTVLALILLLFFQILRPFGGPLLWAITLSVATWPLFARLRARLGGRGGAAALIMVLLMLVVLVVPIAMLVNSLAEQAAAVSALLHDLFALGVPRPPEWLSHIPFAGGRLEAEWQEAMLDTQAWLAKMEPLAGRATRWLIERGAGLGFAVLQLVLAVIIAGVLFVHGEAVIDYLRRFVGRIGTEQSIEAIEVAGRTIRGVAMGVVGTALIQGLLAAVVFGVAAVPGAGLLAALTFLVGVLQLPVLIVPLPVAVWLAYQGLTGWAVFVAIGGLLVGTLDNFLRPYLIRQSGARMPIILIFLGVLGGLLAYGPIGLFFGSVVVAVVHRLVTEWLDQPRRSLV